MLRAVSPLVQIVVGAIALIAGGLIIPARHRLTDILLLFVQWADTAWGRTRIPQSTVVFGVALMLMGLGVLVSGFDRL
jgi:hypothetical protein